MNDKIDIKSLKESLAERCCEKRLETMGISNAELENELYLVDIQGRWHHATVDDIAVEIKNNGSADIVLKCELKDMNSFLDAEIDYQAINNVSDIVYEDGFLAIETNEIFACNKDLSREISIYQAEHPTQEVFLDTEQLKWLDSQSWNGDMDYHSFDDGQDFIR